MTTPTAAELALLKTQPHQSKLYLSIFEPQTVFTARVNDGGAAKGDRVITYDGGSGDYTDVTGGMTLYVGTTAGGKEKGSIWIRRNLTATEITVGENSHINWANNDYLTIVNFYQIWPVYPRYIQSATDITVYKYYDIGYVDENEDLGSLVVMGSHYAGFIDQATGSCSVWWDAAESENVIGMTGTSYLWSFEGGLPTGSVAETPGWVTYDTPGHYKTLLTMTEPAGSNDDYGVRQVSIYDRPGEGSNTPVLAWGMESLAGSREEGGYTARIWVKEDVSSVVDGALVVLFSDDWYGDTQQSIGGNFPNREHILFVGYIIDGSIDYDYQTSTAFFNVGSPSEIMKLGEAFGVSVEDSGNPSADAVDKNKGGSPWFYLMGLSTKTSLYHYYRWHSTVASLVDIRYVGTEFDIQHFNADRTSLYDASDTFLRNTVYGKACFDRQGALYFEIDAGATDDAANTFDTTYDLFNPDWIGNPGITEASEQVAYLELGGVAYYGISSGSGTYSALLAGGPGLIPAYRGTNQRMTGFALTSQGQLNTLVGNIWENMNADYPEVDFDLAGNFRNIDIAPQEIVKVTLAAGDNYRGISWAQKAFTPRSMSWSYNSEQNLLLPSVTLKEITAGDDGQTIAIPVAPPEDSGFDVPPLQLPPPMPAFPIPPLDWGFSGYEFVPAIYNTDNSWVGFYGYVHALGGNTQAQGWHITNPGYAGTAITVYPIIAVSSSSDGTLTYVASFNYSPVNGAGWNYTTTTLATDPWLTLAISGTPGAYTVPGVLIENSCSGNWQIQCYFRRRGDAGSDTIDDDVICVGWLIAYG